jgi:hypothetical protein
LVSGSYPYTLDLSPVITLFRNSGSLLAHSSMSCGTSRLSCCYFGKSSLSTDFSATLCRPKFSVKSCLQNLCWSQPRRQFPGWSNNSRLWLMSTFCQWHQHSGLLTVSWNAGHCAPTWGQFKIDEPLVDLNDPHCIITKSPLNWVDCFFLSIPMFLTKLNALSLLQAFCHLEWNKNATNTYYTTLLFGIWWCCEAAKSHTCTWKCLLLKDNPVAFFTFNFWGISCSLVPKHLSVCPFWCKGSIFRVEV